MNFGLSKPIFLIVSYREGGRQWYQCLQLTKLEARIKLRQVHSALTFISTFAFFERKKKEKRKKTILRENNHSILLIVNVSRFFTMEFRTKWISKIRILHSFETNLPLAMWPDSDPTFPVAALCRLPAAVPTRGGHFFRLEETRKPEYLVSSFVPTFSLVWSLFFIAFYCFVCHPFSSFTVCKTNQIKKRVSNSNEKRWQPLCILNLSSLSQWRPRTVAVYYLFYVFLKEQLRLEYGNI